MHIKQKYFVIHEEVYQVIYCISKVVEYVEYVSDISL
jgi:hypothetical protein